MKPKIKQFLKKNTLFLIVFLLAGFPLSRQEVFRMDNNAQGYASEHAQSVSAAIQIQVVLPKASSQQIVLASTGSQLAGNSCLAQSTQFAGTLNFVQDQSSVNLAQPANCLFFTSKVEVQRSVLARLQVQSSQMNAVKVVVAESKQILSQESFVPGIPMTSTNFFYSFVGLAMLFFVVRRKLTVKAATVFAEKLLAINPLTQAQLQVFRC